MKKFTFRLQKVMELRKWRERSAQQKLAEAQVERKQARRELQGALDRIDTHHEKRRKQVRAGVTAGDALTDANYSRRLLNEASQRAERVTVNERNVTKCRADLIEKSRGKKVLEKLRERRHGEYQIATAREEQSNLDDDAVRRHHREHIDLE